MMIFGFMNSYYIGVIPIRRQNPKVIIIDPNCHLKMGADSKCQLIKINKQWLNLTDRRRNKILGETFALEVIKSNLK